MKNFLQSKFGITLGRRKSYENPEETSSEPLVIPYYYRQCSTLNEKIAWLHSERGQSVLQTRPIPLEFYRNKRIFRLLEEPMWKKKLEEWLYEEPLPPSAPVLSLDGEDLSGAVEGSPVIAQAISASSPSTLPVAVPSTVQQINIFGLGLPKTEDDAEKERRDTCFNEADHPLSLHSLGADPVLRREYKEKYYGILQRSLAASAYFCDSPLPPLIHKDSSAQGKGKASNPPVTAKLSVKDTLADIFEPANHFFSQATLTEDQIFHLYQYGYVVLRGVLSEELVDACVLETEREIFKPGTVGSDYLEFCLDPEKQREFYKKRGDSIRERRLASIRMEQNPSFLSGSCSLLPMMALYYNSPLHHIIDNLLHGLRGPDNHGKPLKKSLTPDHNGTDFFPIQSCQVGYRFGQSGSGKYTTPVLRDSTLAHGPYNLRTTLSDAIEPPASTMSSASSSTVPNGKYVDAFSGGIGPNGWHIDGLMGGIYGSFSLLMAVPLSDQDHPFMGNFCVHPESHSELLPYLQQFYLRSEENRGKSYLERERGVSSLPKPKLKDGVMVSARRGDVILAFHKTAHLGGPNYSDRVRKMAFFRTSHVRHAALREQSFEDFTVEYEGMRQVLFR